jgi:hypothetical protein
MTFLQHPQTICRYGWGAVTLAVTLQACVGLRAPRKVDPVAKLLVLLHTLDVMGSILETSVGVFHVA